MKIKARTLALSFTIALMGLCTLKTAEAQNSTGSVQKPSVVVNAVAAPRNSETLLASFPEADALVYVNTKRITSEILPRILPPAQYESVKSALDLGRQYTGVDVNKIEFAAVAVRFQKPVGGGSPPDYLFVIHGDFAVDALLSLARIAAQGKYKEEKYGSYTVDVFNLGDTVKIDVPGVQGLFSQIAATALDSGTLAIGNPAYLKLALDTGQASTRIRPEILGSAARDSSVLLSMTTLAPASFMKSMGQGGMAGIVNNDELNRLINGVAQFSAALSTSKDDFVLSSSFRMTDVSQAKSLQNLLFVGSQQGAKGVTDPTVRKLIESVMFTSADNLVQVRATVSQSEIANRIKQQLQPPPPPPPAQAEQKKPVS